ncbi:Hypothetical protein A7982_08114 [Minicystis rosea]|nr:Hypothetical protein A7982_08114 [Minicystis rosea]
MFENSRRCSADLLDQGLVASSRSWKAPLRTSTVRTSVTRHASSR